MQACLAENSTYLPSFSPCKHVWLKIAPVFTLTMQAYLAENNVNLYSHHTSMFGRKCLPLSLLSQGKHVWPKVSTFTLTMQACSAENNVYLYCHLYCHLYCRKCLPLLSQYKHVWPKMSTFTLTMQACWAENKVYPHTHRRTHARTHARTLSLTNSLTHSLSHPEKTGFPWLNITLTLSQVFLGQVHVSFNNNDSSPDSDSSLKKIVIDTYIGSFSG